MKLLVALVAGMFLLPSAGHAQAQCTSSGSPCSTAVGTLQVTVTIGATFDLTLTPAATMLATPTTAVYNAGFAATDGPAAVIRSNAPWALSISALTPTWSAVNTQADPARIDKPASDLSWATSALGTYTDLATTPAQVASGPPTLNSTITLFYRTRYQWTLDTPGNYSLQVVFTIAAP